ncbi:MAG: hypothetical protein WC273_02425 [Dehalococcoidia bacterium]
MARRSRAHLGAAAAMLSMLVGLGAGCSVRTPGPSPTPTTAPATRATATPSAAATPWDYCAAIGTIDRPDARYLGDGTREVIQDALAVAERLPQRFADPAARRVAIPWRCMGGAVWACDPGANLPCGPANTSRDPDEGMRTYCTEHPDGVLPAYVTGHDTLYAWSCRGGQAVIDGQPFHVDERGFVAEFWYRLERPR